MRPRPPGAAGDPWGLPHIVRMVDRLGVGIIWRGGDTTGARICLACAGHTCRRPYPRAARHSLIAAAACCGTTPLPQACSCCVIFSPGTPVTCPAGSPIIHSGKAGLSRSCTPRPWTSGGGHGLPTTPAHRSIASAYRSSPLVDPSTSGREPLPSATCRAAAGDPGVGSSSPIRCRACPLPVPGCVVGAGSSWSTRRPAGRAVSQCGQASGGRARCIRR